MLMLNMAQQCVFIFLSPLAGWLMDRSSAAKWMTIALLAKCVLIGTLVNISPLGFIIPVYIFFICGSLFFSLGRMALVPVLIKKSRLVFFNALNERIAMLASMACPVLAGWTIAKTEKNFALGLSILLFLFAVCAVSMARRQNTLFKSPAARKVRVSKSVKSFSHTWRFSTPVLN